MAMTYEQQQAFNKGLDDAIKKQNWSMTNPSSAAQSRQKEKELAAAKAAMGTTTTTTPAAPAAGSEINIPRPEVIKSIAETELLPDEVKAALRAREAGLAGFSAPELAAQRSQMGLAQGAAEKARQRALMAGMARSGLRGGAAAAMTQRGAQMAAQERAAQGQELFLRDIAQKQAARDAYEKTLGGALGQAKQQQFMGLAADITGQQLGSQERIAGRQSEAIEKYGTMMGLASGKLPLI
jgi:hypothetical protein